MSAKKLAMAAVLGGLTFFVWGALSHTIIPFSENALLGFTNEEAVTQAILAGSPKSGVYFLPYMPQGMEKMSPEEASAARHEAEEKMARGPFMLASVHLGEMGSMGNLLVTQLVTDILAALFICLALMKVKGLSFWNQVTAIEFIGLAGFAAVNLPQWNWYAFSGAFTLAELFDTAVGFFLAGMVIAKINPQIQSPAS
ncbi:MAG: hypothetical protein HY708_00500 [Ignavibacteriae bacterium]|nr:hypothetical protein [Ignavibacteriota bacterium]